MKPEPSKTSLERRSVVFQQVRRFYKEAPHSLILSLI